MAFEKSVMNPWDRDFRTGGCIGRDGIEQRQRTGAEILDQIHSQPRSGLKYDDGKPRRTLAYLQAFLGVVKVLEFGAVKYEPESWKNVKPPIRYLDAAIRHLMAYAEGQRVDEESGLPTLDHLMCDLMFLRYFNDHGIELGGYNDG